MKSFPYINKEETMFFSSNGHKGLGGLDLFAARKADESDENSWSKRLKPG